MSVKFSRYCWNVNNLRSSEKLVLLSIADSADVEGMCWPSVNELANRCCMDVRSAIRIINILEKLGYISREMRGGKSTIYRMLTPDIQTTPTPDISVTPDKLSPLTNSTRTPDIQTTPTPDKSSIPPTPPYRDNHHLNHQEPSLPLLEVEKKKFHEEKIPSWIPELQWQEFILMRKGKRKPMTPYAEKLAIQTLDRLRKGGNDPAKVLEQSIMKSWDGLFDIKQSHYGGSDEKRLIPAVPPKSNVRTL